MRPGGRLGISRSARPTDRKPGPPDSGTAPHRSRLVFARSERAALNLALAPRTLPAAESDDRPEFSRFRECPNQHAASPSRLIPALSPRSGLVFADLRIFLTHHPLISRHSYISHQVCDIRPTPKIDMASRDFATMIPTGRQSGSPGSVAFRTASASFLPDFVHFRRAASISHPTGILPVADSEDRLGFSRFRERRNRSVAGPSLLILSHLAPIGPQRLRLSYISETRRPSISLSPRMRHLAESEGRAGPSGFLEDHNWPFVIPGRLIPGHFAPLAPRFR